MRSSFVSPSAKIRQQKAYEVLTADNADQANPAMRGTNNDAETRAKPAYRMVSALADFSREDAMSVVA
jgi:hypothetical protein